MDRTSLWRFWGGIVIFRTRILHKIKKAKKGGHYIGEVSIITRADSNSLNLAFSAELEHVKLKIENLNSTWQIFQ